MLDLTVNTDIGRMNAITEDEATLRSYLEASLRARFNASPCKPSAWYYYGLYDFVLREGRFFTPRARPTNIKCGGPNAFHNSITIASQNRLLYVEGYAARKNRPLALHAWNSDDDGFVVDTTWHPIGVAYFGVIIQASLVYTAKNEDGEMGSAIDNWRRSWPLLRRPWSTTLRNPQCEP